MNEIEGTKDVTRILEGDIHQKLSGVGFVLGAVLVMIGSLLLPRAADLSDVRAMQKAYGAQATLLQVCALLLTFGFWAVMIGTSGFYQSITVDGTVWARLGFYFHLVGGALWTIGMSLDVSYPAAIVNWRKVPAADKELAYSVVTVRSPVGFGQCNCQLASFYLFRYWYGPWQCASSVVRLVRASLRYHWIDDWDNHDVHRLGSLAQCIRIFYGIEYTLVVDSWDLGFAKSMVTSNKTQANKVCRVHWMAESSQNHNHETQSLLLKYLPVGEA